MGKETLHSLFVLMELGFIFIYLLLMVTSSKNSIQSLLIHIDLTYSALIKIKNKRSRPFANL